jgi:hypothetical protein
MHDVLEKSRSVLPAMLFVQAAEAGVQVADNKNQIVNLTGLKYRLLR